MSGAYKIKTGQALASVALDPIRKIYPKSFPKKIMLAFAKDITQAQTALPQECEDAELKQYMDYQGKLDHKRIAYYSLDHAKNNLAQKIKKGRKFPEQLETFLEEAFPISSKFADPKTLQSMIQKMESAHSSTTHWYRMNPYYYALYYDCMKEFIKEYNRMTQESPSRAEVYYISEGEEIDFDDWVYLYFDNLDFHIGRPLEANQYPFAKRNVAIEEEISRQEKTGKSKEEILRAISGEFGIDEISIHLLSGEKIGEKELELFHTSVDNPIYEYLTKKQEGSWESMDGESILDQAIAIGSRLKVWKWKKRKRKIRT